MDVAAGLPPGIPIPKIIGIPVVGIKGRPGIPTIEYIEHRLISRWQHTCHIVSTPHYRRPLALTAC